MKTDAEQLAEATLLIEKLAGAIEILDNGNSGSAQVFEAKALADNWLKSHAVKS